MALGLSHPTRGTLGCKASPTSEQALALDPRNVELLMDAAMHVRTCFDNFRRR